MTSISARQFLAIIGATVVIGCVCCPCAVSSSILQTANLHLTAKSGASSYSTVSPTGSLEKGLSPTSTKPHPAASSAIPTQPITPIASSASPETGLRVIFIDVGQGLSILILNSSGEVALFDAGPADSVTSVLDVLMSNHIHHLDILFVSHPHEDHIGGIPSVLNQVTVSKIVSNGQSHTTVAYEHFLDSALSSNADWIEASEGDTFQMGSALFQVIFPFATRPTGDLNHDSLAIRLSLRNVHFLFMGDADADSEQMILSSGMDISSDVLQAGHHCSRNSSSLSFLELVHPRYAICSVGAGNPYGHPHQEVLDRLVQFGITMLRTDLDRSIEMSSDGTTVTLLQ